MGKRSRSSSPSPSFSSDKGRKHKEKHSKKSKKSKKQHPDIEKISSQDYYKKQNEFRHWLLKKRGIYLEDLLTKEGKDYFEKFISRWNKGKLSGKYYKGLAADDEAPRTWTKYQWNFANQVDPVELGNIRSKVHQETNQQWQSLNQDQRELYQTSSNTSTYDVGPSIGPRIPPELIQHPSQRIMEEEDREEYQKWLNKQDKKKWKKQKDVVEEELVPKKTGREAMIEKKKMKSAYTKPVEEESIDLDDKQMYGGSLDYQNLLKKKKERQKQKILEKQSEQERKWEEYQQKEAEKMAPFLALIRSGQYQNPLDNSKKF